MICASCGALTPPAHQVCARCGAAPQPTALAGPVAAPPSGPPVLPGDAVVIEGAGVPAAVRPTRRLAFVTTLGALAGVLMLAGVGSLMLSGLSGRSGGAASAEQAVDELFGAIEGKDPLGVLATLSPTEVRSVADVIESLQGHVVDAGYPDMGSVLDAVDIDIAYQDLAVTPLSDDAARVEVAGVTVSYTIDPGQLPPELGAVVEEGLDDLSGSLTPEQGWGRPLQLVAVRDGGGWYVSPLYSATEHAMESQGLPPGDFAAAARRPAPPADVASFMAQGEAAIEAFDLRAGLDLMSVDALGIGLVYGEAIDGAIADLEEELGAPLDQLVQIEIDDVQFSHRDEGDLVYLTTEALSGTVTVTEEAGMSPIAVSFRFDGDCFEITTEGETEQRCSSDESFATTPVSVLVREDGGIRFSPVATMAYHAMAALESFDAGEALSYFGMSQLQPPVAHLEADQPVTVELDDTGTAVVTFDGTAGQVVTFDHGAGDDFDSYLEVRSPSAEWLDCYERCELSETGTYRVVITSWSDRSAVEISYHVQE